MGPWIGCILEAVFAPFWWRVSLGRYMAGVVQKWGGLFEVAWFQSTSRQVGERRASGLCTSAPYWAGGQTETLGPLPKYRDLDWVGLVGFERIVGIEAFGCKVFSAWPRQG